MKDYDSKLSDAIISHEGSERYAYQDSMGFTTVGIGRNIDKHGGNGLSMDEQLYLLNNDILRCRSELLRCDFYKNEINAVRQDALVELCFNMGLSGLLKFVKMLSFFQEKNYKAATIELVDSKWAKQVSIDRVHDICFRIENGSYQ